MRKDPTEFRKRFAAWKDGKKPYENGLPKYQDGKDLQWDTFNYKIPYIPEKSIKLTNAGLATGARISTNVLDSLANTAEEIGLPIQTAIGLATKESTLGNPTDDRSMRTLLSVKNREALEHELWKRGIRGKDQYGLHLVPDDAKTFYWDLLSLINYYNGEHHEPDFFHRKENINNLPSTLKKGLLFYRDHPDKYNPGQKNYQQLVDKRGAEVMGSPEVLKWLKERNIKKATGRFNRLNPLLNESKFNLPKYASGKIPGYKIGTEEDVEELIKRRLEQRSDATTVQIQKPVLPIKRDFIAEALRKHAAEAVGPDTRSSYQRKQSQEAKLYANQQYLKAKDDAKRAEGLELMMKTISPSTYVEAATGLDLGTVGRFVTDAAAFGLPGLLKYGAAKAATSPIMQYVRYPIGKIRFGFDAQLPTLYRKVKSLPTIENGMIKISTPQNRFAFENGYGEESPLITNFTTDAPVRSHSAGNWDRGVTLAIPGKKLLGKNVISTRPSDTFTYGNDIQVNVGDVTAITGRQKEIDFLTNHGINTITSDKLKSKFAEDAVKYMQDIAKVRATYPRVFGQKGIILLKPKTPIEDFSNYAAEVENTSRNFFTNPTLKDYKFMDYVFRPKYTSETMPVYNVSSLESLNQAPQLGEWVGEDTKRMYLLDANRWKNVMYDPSTFAESQFRQGLNIGLKPEYRK